MSRRRMRRRPPTRPGTTSVLAAGLLAVVMAATAVVPASADLADRFERDIRELEEQQARLRTEADRLEEEQRRVRAEQERIATDLQAATDRLAEVEARLADVVDAAADTAREVATLTDRRDRKRRQLGDRARALYQHGGLDPVLMFLSGQSPVEAVETAHYVAALAHEDQASIEAVTATTTRLQRRQRDLDDERQQVARLRREVEVARTALAARMEEATAAEDRLAVLREQATANLARLEERERSRRAEEQRRLAAIERRRQEERAAAQAATERRARSASRADRSVSGASRSGASPSGASPSGAAPAPARGGMACPQAQPRSFTNDWGAARSGGRRHQGTDIFGRMGGNVYAITSGTIQFTKSGGSAGLFLSLRGDDGHVYWYMHLSGFAARSGQRVSAGQLIAYNGNTGNARGATPHIHFEYHPGGGGATNPYPLLRSVC